MALLRTAEAFVLLVLRVALGGLFLWAAYQKLGSNPQAFADSIKAFHLLPESGDHLVVLATFVVPWIEAIAGACLVLGLWSRAAGGVLLLTLAAFCAAIVSVLQRGIDTKCGCFGEFSPFCPEAITSCNLIQNGVLGAVALLILLRGGGMLALDGRPRATPAAARAGGSAAGSASPVAAPPAARPAPSIKQAAANAPRAVGAGGGGGPVATTPPGSAARTPQARPPQQGPAGR